MLLTRRAAILSAALTLSACKPSLPIPFSRALLTRGSADVGFAVLDERTGSTFGLRENEGVPAGSLAKLLLLIASLQRCSSGRWSLNAALPASPAALVASSDRLRIPAGSNVALGAALRYMIVDSDNLAANLVISALGPDAINRTAAELDLPRTRIGGFYQDHPAGTDPHRTKTSPNDLLTMLLLINRASRGESKIISRQFGAYAIDLLEEQKDRRYLRGGIPRTVLCANKTEEIDRVSGDAMILGPGLERSTYIAAIAIGGTVEDRLLVMENLGAACYGDFYLNQ
jgi:beta-lactamase class A